MTGLDGPARDSIYRDLLLQVTALRNSMLELEKETLPRVGAIQEENVESARNLAHYLALRRGDVRPLQEKLAAVGLSSLGRSESHVFATVDAVYGMLTDLVGTPGDSTGHGGLSYEDGRALLKRNSAALLGVAPKQRRVRIMVTMPTEAARDYALVEDLLTAGMDVMRINCAHDDPPTWIQMIENLKRAKAATRHECRIIMDIPGPKVRTGPMEPGPRVRKVRPRRSQTGSVIAPATVALTLDGDSQPASAADASIPLESEISLRTEIKPGYRLRFKDARGSKRSLRVVSVDDSRIITELRKTAYFETGATVNLDAGEGGETPVGVIGELPPVAVLLLVKKGDQVLLTRGQAPGHGATYGPDGAVTSLMEVSCTLPKAIDSLKVGESVWFDDGKVGGVVRRVGDEGALVEVTSAPSGGFALGPDKGINLPETDLHLPSISEADDVALRFIARNADLVGQSFVRSPEDVLSLQSRLNELGGGDVGIVLKIETRQGFNNLPSLLFAAMRTRSAGVMIARGDLAVECGWERLAEIQEEILWFCEAAHMPVIWATQVLETLTKTGLPSRAEITDAASSESAECVMLNKGPHAVEAAKALDDILRRMQSHKEKKSAMLRRLRVADNFAVA